MAGGFLVGVDVGVGGDAAAAAAAPAAIAAASAIERVIGFGMTLTLAATGVRGLYEFIDLVAVIGRRA